MRLFKFSLKLLLYILIFPICTNTSVKKKFFYIFIVIISLKLLKSISYNTLPVNDFQQAGFMASQSR